MKKMNLIITMAGMGSRFRNAGYKIPKFSITAKGKTLFEWSMESLSGIFDHIEMSIFIVQKSDNATSFIEECCSKLNIPNPKIVEIDGLTDGQATTVLSAKSIWNEDAPIYIYNIDTYIEKNEITTQQIKGDGFIPCFQGKGDHWSFVKVNNLGRAIEVSEKKRISPYCSLGAYYFSSGKLYSSLYQKYYSIEKNLINGEKYIAPIYNLLIEQGKDVFISDISPSKVYPLGTPDELNIFLKKE